jgi:hypothetical protein
MTRNPSVDFEPSSDPLQRGVDLRYSSRLPLVGIPTVYRSNSKAVVDIVDEALGSWRDFRGALDASLGDEVTIKIVVQQGEERFASPPTFRYRMPDPHRVLVSAPGCVAISDVARREAIAYVSPEVVAHRERFRYGLVEALANFIIGYLDRQPLHTAAVVRDSVAVLLFAGAGVGKSTLTYAAKRAGYRVMSEDFVWLQLDPRLRVWGLATRVYLSPDATTFFPELDGAASTTIDVNGDEKLAVPIQPHERPDRPFADRVAVCVLERSPTGESRLDRLQESDVHDRVTDVREPGFDLFADTIEAAADQLSRDGGWRLSIGRDPFGALPLIDTIVSDRLQRS